MAEAPGWSEENSRNFIQYASYDVPERELQIQTLCSLVPDPGTPFHVLELACGEGLLAGAFLERFPDCTVTGLDGSLEMLRAARQRLEVFGERFSARHFNLFSSDWLAKEPRYAAIVSSLALHHLDGPQKVRLIRAVYDMLQPGGAFLIADIILPASSLAMRYAADAYDDVVRQQALRIDGDLRPFERFQREQWNFFRYPDDPVDKPSTLLDQLQWLQEAGFQGVDVYWMKAGHAIFGGYKTRL